MKTMHLFAGIGGGLLADRILGHDPIIAVEWDGYACQVLRERAADGWFPNLQVWEGDVRLFDPSEYAGRVGCIHSGFPCQDISVAGKQAGVGEETRSGLYREVLRIADVVRPKYLFLENVAAILSVGGATVIADLAARGYVGEWLCLRASDCGAKHHRDRWWCLCTYTSSVDGRAEQGYQQQEGDSRWQPSGDLCGDVPDPGSERLEGWVFAGDVGKEIIQRGECVYGDTQQLSDCDYRGYWAIEPNVGRVADGIPHRIHRLKGLGNAQVPLQAAVAWKLLGGE